MESIPVNEIGGILAAIIALITGALKSFKFVQEGEEGIKLRFGKAVRTGRNKAPKIYHPGFVMLIPFVETLQRRHVRVQTIDLPQQIVTIENGLSYVIDAVLRFRVKDIYKALFVVDDLDKTMINVGMAELRDVITPSADQTEMSDVEGMSEKLTQKIKSHSEIWGVEIEKFAIVSCVPTSESQQIVNVATGVKSRVTALIEGFKTLGIGEKEIGGYAQLAAALIGIPVATTIGVVTATPPPPEPKSSKEDEE